jgi:hypothetical protein
VDSYACEDHVLSLFVDFSAKMVIARPCRVQKDLKKKTFVLPVVCSVASGLRVVFRVSVSCVLHRF